MRSAKALVAFMGVVLAGCAADPPMEEESVEAASSGVTTTNAFTSNAFTSNAFTSNAFTSNAFTSNAFTSNAFTSNALAAIQDPSAEGVLARSFVRYAAACAFKASQSFDFTWTDSDGIVHEESYPGQLGIAPHWATGPLGKKGEHMVSACLAAKVNYYGVPVTISVRSGEQPLRLKPFDDEQDAFPNIEGAFWGNLWDEDGPYINSCYVPANVANSRAQHRDCAAGHVTSNGTIEECGIINIMGPCQSACKNFNYARGNYGQCREAYKSHKYTKYVITTALP